MSNEYMSRGDYCEENCGKENREGYKTCTNCGMLNVPTADVQPVKRGRWIYSDIPVFGNPYGRYCCSLCGTAMDSGTDNYCPCCGARMDGDTK